jgi:hypothetical protein
VISPLRVATEGLVSTQPLSMATLGWLYVVVGTGWREIWRFVLYLYRAVELELER